MAVETYSHVMHIVSSVSGTLRDGVDAMDALRASLPAGTLSGAPKIRAMQIIDELEPVKRGPYGGAVGYLTYTGDLDTCIYIRSALVQGRRACTSRPAAASWPTPIPRYEVRETEAKAGAVLERDRAGVRAGGLGVTRVLVIDNYDSFTYNLVQYLGELGAELDVVRNDARRRELLEREPGPGGHLARARARPTRPACRSRRSARFAEARHAGAGRVPRPPGAGEAFGGQRRARRAGARQDRRGRARRQDDLRAASRTRSWPGATTRWSSTPTLPGRARGVGAPAATS